MLIELDLFYHCMLLASNTVCLKKAITFLESCHTNIMIENKRQKRKHFSFAKAEVNS